MVQTIRRDTPVQGAGVQQVTRQQPAVTQQRPGVRHVGGGQQIGGPFTARPQQQVLSMTPRRQPGQQDLIRQLTEQMTGQQQAQRTAAEQQHEQLMQMFAQTQEGVRGLHQEAREGVAGVGEAARTRAAQDARRQQALQQQQMMSRGLGGATVAATAQRGVRRDHELAQQQIDEQQAQLFAGLATQQAGAEQQLGRFGAQAITAAQHEPPQMQAYLQLIQQLAAQGGF